MNAINRDQKNGPGRAGAARMGQSPVHIPAHGERGVEYSYPSCFDAVTSINWPGRFANRRSGLFPHSRVARAFSRSVEPRRRAGQQPPDARLVATPIEFVRAVMAARRQLKTSSHKFARQSTESLSLHLERLSCGPVAYEQTKPRKVSHSAGKTTQGLGNV